VNKLVPQLVDVFGYLSVVLRGFTLAFESLVIGGVAFSLFVNAQPAGSSDSDLADIRRSQRKLLRISAVSLALSQVILLFLDSTVLMGTTDMGLSDLAGASYFVAGSVIFVSGLMIAVLSRTRSNGGIIVMSLLCVVILGASVSTTHAVARLDNRAGLTLLTGLHQVGAAMWIGGLPYLLVSLREAPGETVARLWCRRFSRLAMSAVGLLVGAGILMSILYIDSINAIYGTAYGVMVMSKVALFLIAVGIGALNFSVIRGARTDASSLTTQVRRFTEAEIGIGFTVILAAAALTSQPPAVDMQFARVSASEIVERMSPRVPRLNSPSATELSTPALQSQLNTSAADFAPPPSFVPGQTAFRPSKPADLAWSEYNHHWAGLIVMLMGLLALASRSGGAAWMRNWPLLFGVLAVFLFLRADPESWPLGLNGFWISFADSEVLQHRIFIVLIIMFAVYEWRVQNGAPVRGGVRYVFPLVCALGGALLLTHSHSLGNIKEELLAELSHVPLAILGVVAGWSRWLELRLPSKDARIPSLIWPVCFVLVGVFLVNYRES